MTFKDYLKAANELAARNPETLEMQVIFAIDNEGNKFVPCEHVPSAGLLSNEEFFNDNDLAVDFPDLVGKVTFNVVCIN